MGQDRVGNHEVGLVQLAVVKGSGLVVEAAGQFRRLGKSPGQLFVAVLVVAFALGLAVAGPLRGDRPAA
jgi:hypothetical protein